jgi:diguanylate cyclase (GGDEF)-like protein
LTIKSTPAVLRHLHIKLSAAGFAVQCMICVFFLFSEWHDAKTKSRAALAQTLTQVTPLLRTALVDPLLLRDEPVVRHILGDAQAAGLMQDYVLRGPQGQTLQYSANAVTWPVAQGDAFESPEPWTRDPPVFHHHIRIEQAGQHLGTLELVIPLQDVVDTYQTALVKNALLALFLMMAGTLAIYLMSETITRQLRTIAMASKMMASGEHRFDIPVRGEDEVAQLGRSINLMSQAIRERIATLTESEKKQRRYFELAQAEHARLVALLQSMHLGVLLVDQQQKVLHINDSCLRFWQVAPGLDLVDHPLDDFLSASVRYTQAAQTDRSAWLAMAAQDAQARIEIKLEDLTLEQTSHTVQDANGQTIGCLWIFEDVTRERAAQATIHRLVEQDTLTGAFNRHTLMERLQDKVQQQADQAWPLLYLDLDNFKNANDLHGHAFGDKLLVQVTQAMQSALRPGDIMGRIGGDEFVIVPHGMALEQVHILCARLIKCINDTSLQLLGDTPASNPIGCSIGIAVHPQDGQTAEALLDAADSAMYAAKAKGRNTWQWSKAPLPQDPPL